MASKQLFSVFSKLVISTNSLNIARPICTTSSKLREVVNRKEMLKTVPAMDEGTQGEKSVEIDYGLNKHELFPTAETPNKLFNGIPFKDIPIFHIKVSKNNTLIALTDAKGDFKIVRSCGSEGFKHTRKGTNIAAQATAITIGTKAREQGYKTIRVKVKGLGPGRMSAIKGLQMSGLEIISITDATPVSWNPPRPRKPKRL
ncbi:unnamed protein product [Phyllotreta striolata]|uniref:Ribosomal protein S11 n=1 Tax=Phyllotreta striolata TaxID=444603 RepID=A0A9N9XN24_PHYSR|nr:unnamed protein product [Phyllotreta striolata]